MLAVAEGPVRIPLERGRLVPVASIVGYPMQNDTLDTLVYTVPEAANVLGVSRATLYRLWHRGWGPPRVRIGGRTLIGRRELSDWFKSLEVVAGDAR